MRIIIGTFVLLFSLGEATYHPKPLNAHALGVHGLGLHSAANLNKCVGLGCTSLALPQQVVIPQFIPSQPLHTKPLLHKHGLIQVQLPASQYYAVPPATMAAKPEFKVASARMGKVVDRTAPQYFCKRPGFVLEGQTCVQTIVEAARFVCPGGFDTYDGICQRRAAYLQNCPLGYSRRDGNCAKIITAEFVYRCPDGSYSNGATECVRQVPHPLTPTCPEGTYDARTGSCILQSFLEARAFCPEGFTFVDGACLQEEVYDCTSHAQQHHLELPKISTLAVAPIATVAQVAPLPNLHTHSNTLALHHAHHGRQLTATKDCGAAAQSCAVTCTVQPCPPCVAQRALPCEAEIAVAAVAPKVITQPTKTTISVQKTCTRVTSTALIFACDDGLLQGNRCLVKSSVAPLPVCSAEGDTAFCFARQRVPAIQECPQDYTKECLPGRTCECVALEAAAFLQSCPSGFDQENDGCVRTAQVRPVCPQGFAIQGDQCLQVLREPADCVFSVTYECDHTSNANECAPPATGAVGTFSVTPTTIPTLPVPIPVF